MGWAQRSGLNWAHHGQWCDFGGETATGHIIILPVCGHPAEVLGLLCLAAHHVGYRLRAGPPLCAHPVVLCPEAPLGLLLRAVVWPLGLLPVLPASLLVLLLPVLVLLLPVLRAPLVLLW